MQAVREGGLHGFLHTHLCHAEHRGRQWWGWPHERKPQWEQEQEQEQEQESKQESGRKQQASSWIPGCGGQRGQQRC
jgi:hypothetical protein